MSVAEVVSMAMAELLVVMFWRHQGDMAGRMLAQRRFLEKKIFIVTGSRRVGDDGRHVDQGSPC